MGNGACQSQSYVGRGTVVPDSARVKPDSAQVGSGLTVQPLPGNPTLSTEPGSTSSFSSRGSSVSLPGGGFASGGTSPGLATQPVSGLGSASSSSYGGSSVSGGRFASNPGSGSASSFSSRGSSVSLPGGGFASGGT